jgi:hypothetical protein
MNATEARFVSDRNKRYIQLCNLVLNQIKIAAEYERTLVIISEPWMYESNPPKGGYRISAMADTVSYYLKELGYNMDWYNGTTTNPTPCFHISW